VIARAGAAAAAVLLAALLLAPGAAAAPATVEPWRAAEQIAERLLRAQTSLLLEGAGSGDDAVAAARAYRGRLRAGLRSADPRAHRDVLAGLRSARRARTAAAAAAARGQVQGALLRGAAAAAARATERGDVAQARAWLLLREFRTPTRYTRPGADATLALRALARRATSRDAARLAVVKDLLDATQGRARERVDELARVQERGFATRRAELAARLAAAWPLLAPRLRAERGEAAERAATAAVAALRAAGARAGDAGPGFARARAAVAAALASFTAAPLTEEERARRANQLLKFVSLVGVEWDHGVEGTRVTIPFEIQEALAFSRAARAALSDLQGAMSRIDARATDDAARRLAALDATLRAAQARPAAVPAVDAVEADVEALAERLRGVFPDAWEEQSDEGDFDLVQITLDRLEQQVAAGQYRQAEQTRIEAYAIFEFGPERRLAAFDPALVADIEGLIWFGARDRPGLAELVSGRAPRREVRETRRVLDEQLANAAATLGDGASRATVVTNAAIIVFREGLEAVLILAAITASFLGANRRKRRPVLLGALAGLVVSVLTFGLAITLLGSLQQYGERLEAVVGIVAIVVLLLVMNWFFHRVYWTEWISGFHRRRKALLARDESAKVAFVSAQVLGLFLLGLTSVYREGFETVLFLQSLELSAGLAATVQGSLLGLVAVGVVALLTFRLQRKLPYKRMLVVTGVLLAFVLVVMVGSTVRTMQGAGWLPISPLDVELPYALGTWLGVFPTWETLGGQVLAVVLVLGSYVAAEQIRVKRPRRRAERRRQASRATAA